MRKASAYAFRKYLRLSALRKVEAINEIISNTAMGYVSAPGVKAMYALRPVAAISKMIRI